MKGKRIYLLLALVMALVLASGTLTGWAGEHQHKWSEWKVDKKATCTEAGTSSRTCSAEGCPVGVEYDYNTPKATGHKWKGFVVTTQSTCTSEGTETNTCEVCGTTETRSLAKKAHDMVGWHQTKPATCDEEGEEKTYCKTCDTQTLTRKLSKLSHNWGAWNPVAGKIAECEKDGEEIRYCSNCGTTETRVVPKLNHNYGPWSGNPDPTCLKDGVRQRICSRCGDVKTEPVAKINHNYGAWVAGDNPTCVKAGSKYRVCSVCNEKETVAVPALGKDATATHKMSAWKETTKPTCTAVGKEQRTCENGCGRVETRDIKKLDHTSDGKWVTVREGDLRNLTKQATTCTVCKQEAKVKVFSPRGIKHEQMTYAFGVPAAQAGLSGGGAQLIYLNMAQEGTYKFPLVTPDQRHIGFANVSVANGSVKVSLEKNGETASLLRYRFWQLFPDAQAVSAGKLKGESLPFDQAVSVSGESCVIVVHTLANYYTTGVNTVFNDALAAWDGQSYRDIRETMLQGMKAGE